MVKDFKGYREKTDEKPKSPGWSILVVSHLAILLVGISLGYWVSRRLANDSIGPETVSREVEARKASPPALAAKNGKMPPDQAPGTEKTDKQSLRPQDRPEEEPRFTFYESLPKGVIPDTEVPADHGETQKGPPSTDAIRESSGIPGGSIRSTPEPTSVIYYVQVGSFREEKRAKQLRDHLRGKGYPVEVAPAAVKNKGIWYRVRWGPFGDKTEANEKLRAIAESEKLQPVLWPEKREKSP